MCLRCVGSRKRACRSSPLAAVVYKVPQEREEGPPTETCARSRTLGIHRSSKPPHEAFCLYAEEAKVDLPRHYIPEMVHSIFCIKYEAQGLLSSNHGKPFFGRRGWDTGRHRSFPDRFRDGLRGRILSCESSQCRWFLLEFLRSEHFWHYAYTDAARRMHPLLERSKRYRLVPNCGGCTLHSVGRDCQHAHLFAAD